MGVAETYIEQVSYEHGLNSIRPPHLGTAFYELIQEQGLRVWVRRIRCWQNNKGW